MFTNSQCFVNQNASKPRQNFDLSNYQFKLLYLYKKEHKSDTTTVINFKITFMGENWHFPWLVLGMLLFKQQNGAETQHFCSERDCMFCINHQRPNLATKPAPVSLKNGGCQHFVIHLCSIYGNRAIPNKTTLLQTA